MPGPGAGDDREARLGEQPRDFLRGQVLRIVGMRARRAEDRDALLDVREVVEAFDELAHDAHHAPRVGAREVVAVAAGLQQLFVFGLGTDPAPDRVVDDSRARPTVRWRVFCDGGVRPAARCPASVRSRKPS